MAASWPPGSVSGQVRAQRDDDCSQVNHPQNEDIYLHPFSLCRWGGVPCAGGLGCTLCLCQAAGVYLVPARCPSTRGGTRNGFTTFKIRAVPFVPSLPPVPCLLPGLLGCSLAASWVLPGCGTTKGEQGSAREAREQPRGPAAREQPGSRHTDQEQLKSYPKAYLQFIYSLSTAYPTAYLQSISLFLRKRTNAR